jgi:hypothetical protein
MRPCLFDLKSDPRERNDLSATQPSRLEQLWRMLNVSWFGYYHARSPAHLLGPCNGAAAVASLCAAVLTEIYLCNVCSCQKY